MDPAVDPGVGARHLIVLQAVLIPSPTESRSGIDKPMTRPLQRHGAEPRERLVFRNQARGISLPVRIFAKQN
jgi:hypothetical protein